MAASSSPTQTGTSRRNIVLAVILGCQIMMTLDALIVTTALPHIQTEIGFTPSAPSWIQHSYVLVFGGLLLLGARAGDLWGRRRVFVAGVVVFTLASLLAGLAPTAELLIAARALQGFASAFAIPATLALRVSAFPAPEERSRAIAVYSAVIGAGASVGIIVRRRLHRVLVVAVESPHQRHHRRPRGAARPPRAARDRAAARPNRHSRRVHHHPRHVGPGLRPGRGCAGRLGKPPHDRPIENIAPTIRTRPM
jgi:hypothetical protein